MNDNRVEANNAVRDFLLKHDFPFIDNNTTQYVNQWFKLEGEVACELRQFIQLMFGVNEKYSYVVVRKSYVRPDYYFVNHPELYTLIKESRRDEHS